ncbi:MAG TPA: alpha/beta hydrolase [Chloroflexota bacterium]|nr:alpha/beta hydrolase [Chloroflexota bacterium]
MPTVSLNGAELYYEDRGSGPRVLFIHAMCGNANVWDGQVDRVGDRFRCVTYDRRGHSRSTLGAIEQRTVEMHGDDAAALIRALGLAQCLLVGSSGGARVALDVMLRYPELLRGAVLSEPPLFALDPTGAAQFQAEVRPKLQQAMAAGGPRAAVDAFFDYVCPGLWRAIDEERREIYRANAGELLPDLQMPTYQVELDDLSRVQIPCLVVKGNHLKDIRQLSGRLFGCRFARLARLLEEFVEQCRAEFRLGQGLYARPATGERLDSR